MDSKNKEKELDLEQHLLVEHAQQRIKEKKRLFAHFVVFLIGSVFLVIINKILKYGAEYNWFVWAITLWAFLFVIHVFNVFVTHKFMGADWERSQRERLVAHQKKKIAKIQADVEKEHPLPIGVKKKVLRKIILIAAAGTENELGLNNDLPWHLPDDFKRFKNLTTGHKIIMGRKTLESFPKALPNREHIVITRNKSFKPKFDATVVNSLEQALERAHDNETVYIIGGGEIYRMAMGVASHIELTRVHGTFEADTYFPEIDPNSWRLVHEEYHPKDDRHLMDFTYQTWERI